MNDTYNVNVNGKNYTVKIKCSDFGGSSQATGLYQDVAFQCQHQQAPWVTTKKQGHFPPR